MAYFFYRRPFEARLCGKFLVQSILIALHALLYFSLYVDPVRHGRYSPEDSYRLPPSPYALFTEYEIIRNLFVLFKFTKPTIYKI